jgi:hypothetical protein
LDGDDMNQLNGLLSDSSVRIRFAAAEYLNNAVLKEVTVDARGTLWPLSHLSKALLNVLTP